MANTYVAQPIDGNGRAASDCGVSNGVGYAIVQLDNFVSIDPVTGQPTSVSLVSTGGMNTAAVAASKTTDTVIKPTVGRLCRILITTAGTNALVIWDNASGHTGTIVGYIAASAPAGTLVDVQMPCVNGITVQGNAANPAFTVSYS